MSRLKTSIGRKNFFRSVNSQLDFSGIFSFITWHFFWKLTRKIIFQNPTINVRKARVYILRMLWWRRRKNLSYFENLSAEEIEFKVWLCRKTSVICRSRICQLSDQKKLALKFRLSLHVLWKFELIWIYRLGGDRFWSYKNISL